MAKGNQMANTLPRVSGIQVYGSDNQVIDNQLDDGAVILIGSGEANTPPGDQPKGDHLPASHALVEGNKGGTIILNYSYGRERMRHGKKKKYQFKATGVKLENNTSKVVDNAKKKKGS